MTHEDWLAEGNKRFGPHYEQWQFVCPKCGTIQSIDDLMLAGVKPADSLRYMAFSCIGRFTNNGLGCDWTLGGLFQIHTLEVLTEDGVRPAFEFAPGNNSDEEER